ncbi:MAG: glucokinase [Methylococcales bacterium]|nr:glucokinase [Methylococcales bacterium]
MLLAGDVGGTKTVLAIFSLEGQSVREQTFASANFACFDDLLKAFLDTESLTAVCIGVAGPVHNGRCQTTNLPWLLDSTTIAAQTGGAKTWLLNDLEATAWGILSLPDSAFADLGVNTTTEPGHKAVLAAGTGLGEAIIAYRAADQSYQVLPTEGGHSDFAPHNDLEIDLLEALRQQFPDHVSNERVICGPGLQAIYSFLCARCGKHVQPTPAPSIISERALAGDDAIAVQALTLFCQLYGAEAGNLALKCLPGGGVYLAGGIAPKILGFLKNGAFIERFVQKGRYQSYLAGLAVKVCLEPKAALLGAAAYARQHIQTSS